MPLDGQDRERPVYEAFDHTVCGTAYREQIVPQMIDSLMMGGIYEDAHAVELIKEVPAP